MGDNSHRQGRGVTAPESTDRLAVGALAVDTARQRLGRVMGYYAGRCQLRPPAGGLEWDADPTYVRAAREDEIFHAREMGGRWAT